LYYISFLLEPQLIYINEGREFSIRYFRPAAAALRAMLQLCDKTTEDIDLGELLC